MKNISKLRNGAALAASLRRGGPMRNKRDKRAQENKNPDFIAEDIDLTQVEQVEINSQQSSNREESPSVQAEENILSNKEEQE